MAKLLTILIGAVAFGLASSAAAAASPSDDAYLATIKSNGVPIYGEDYVIALGHEVCRTARQNPSMNKVDLAMSVVTSEYRPTPYDYAQARVIVTSALANYCPDAA
jgi:hypothetical protein